MEKYRTMKYKYHPFKPENHVSLIYVLFALLIVGCNIKDEPIVFSTDLDQSNQELPTKTHAPEPTLTSTQRPIPTEMPTITPTLIPRQATSTPNQTATTILFPEEKAVTPIPLNGDSSSRNSEISGMAWYEDWLILLPQYPNFGGKDGRLFVIHKNDIVGFLEGRVTDSLNPTIIPFKSNDISDNLDGFEGYEAIIFDGDTAYLTIEARTLSGMTGYITSGKMNDDLTGLEIDPTNIIEIQSASKLPNKSEEALLIYQDKLHSLHEANGKKVNEKPAANVLDLNLNYIGTSHFPHIEYRITDTTEVDEEGRFWIINYFFPGELELYSAEDPISEKYDLGQSHSTSLGIERILEMQIDDQGITLVDNPPIQLELLPGKLRNWEGIVRLEGFGLLIVTDKYPETILGFVPFSD